MFERFRRERRARAQARTLYAAVMRVVREPVFYREFGVPDTFEGRFDLLVLVTCLVMRRLRALGGDGKPVMQALFDTLFEDMDVLLREAGMSDTSVAKKARAMASAFYGRGKAYDEALDGPDAHDFAVVVARNVLGDAAADSRRLSDFARGLERALEHKNLEHLVRGELPAVDAVSEAA